jgi:hypothetical protein
MDKLNQLSLGEKLVGGGGVLMLIASFLPWYKISFGIAGLAHVSVSRNGWQSPGGLWSLLAVLISIALAGSIAAVKFGNMKMPDLGSVTWGQAYLGGGAAVALCVIIKLINESSYISFGFYLGIIAAAAVAAGGYLLYTEEKTGVSRS